MNITLCGSIAFIDEMLAAKKELERMGHEVQAPPSEILREEILGMRPRVLDGDPARIV